MLEFVKGSNFGDYGDGGYGLSLDKSQDAIYIYVNILSFDLFV